MVSDLRAPTEESAASIEGAQKAWVGDPDFGLSERGARIRKLAWALSESHLAAIEQLEIARTGRSPTARTVSPGTSRRALEAEVAPLDKALGRPIVEDGPSSSPTPARR